MSGHRLPQALVVVPTYNERANLPTLVQQLMHYDNISVLVVDDQSPDGTGAVADELSAQHPGRMTVLHRKEKRGFGLSYVDGLTRALAGTSDVICQMDADLSHDPKQLPALIDATARADIVVGSRYVPGGAIVNWPWQRRLLSRTANIYIRSITRLGVHDCTSGYRCWRRDALARVPLTDLRSNGYSFLIEMLFKAVGLGLAVTEVPITFVERREGESKISSAVLIESAWTPWRLVAKGRSH
jgi:dolichol-phosphate mannosyltransferase